MFRIGEFPDSGLNSIHRNSEGRLSSQTPIGGWHHEARGAEAKDQPDLLAGRVCRTQRTADLMPYRGRGLHGTSGVEIRILAQFALQLMPLLFLLEQLFAGQKMAPLDATLSRGEQSGQRE